MIDLNQAQAPQTAMKIGPWRRLAEILWHRDYEIAKCAGAIIWIFWSLALLNPYASTFASSSSFRAMAAIAPESIWGIIGLVLAVNELCSALFDYRAWRIIASGLLWGWALLIGTMIGLANPMGTAIAVYPGLGFISLFAFLRSFRMSRPIDGS